MSLFTPGDPRPIHFMGIAGAGMSALALIARRRGVDVTGCDTDLHNAADVIRAGAVVWSGHDPAHVQDTRAVVHTSAVARDHEELEAAAALGVPIFRRAEALAALVDGHRTVGVAGTHGKTTTTAMVTNALAATGLRPTGIAGGRVSEWGGNARIDGEDLFVVEADEYDRSFLELRPTVAVVNNVEADHLECYGSLNALEDAFVDFAGRADRLLVGSDDPGALKVASRVDVPYSTVGIASDADFQVRDVVADAKTSTANLALPDDSMLALGLTVPGIHNLCNAAMAVAVAHVLGADTTAAARALATFHGVERRFQEIGTRCGVTVVDDYAHHPSEITATISAARQRFPKRRLVAVFQPHLFSRTQQLGDHLGAALADADLVVLTEIYPAREQPIAGITGKLVAEAARRAGAPEVEWVPQRSDLGAHLAARVADGDVVLILGAGDITETATDLLARLAGAAA